jgi:L-alanine-DL-glutamate epimerase-like enolase superfamily enzyme
MSVDLAAGEQVSEHAIAKVEAIRLKLPYHKPVMFHSLKQFGGEYVLLRIVLENGMEGIAESCARPEHTGEDATLIAYQIDTFFKPRLIGMDPLGHQALLQDIAVIRECRAARALIDVALWDLRGKVFGQPVWRLLGGTAPEPVPLTWIAHGNARADQVAEARRAVEERGFKGLKMKTWRRSHEDVVMVGETRAAVGDKHVMYIDTNGSYTESEARTILPSMKEHSVSFIEEPCDFTDPTRQADMAKELPIALLGDQCCESLTAVNTLIKLNAVGAVSVKLRKTGITESLKIISVCEAASIPVVIGTDSESRIGSLVRMHLRSAIPHLHPWPTETHFFFKLSDDTFAGEFLFRDGTITPTDAPGFGADVDWKKVEKYRF